MHSAKSDPQASIVVIARTEAPRVALFVPLKLKPAWYHLWQKVPRRQVNYSCWCYWPPYANVSDAQKDSQSRRLIGSNDAVWWREVMCCGDSSKLRCGSKASNPGWSDTECLISSQIKAVDWLLEARDRREFRTDLIYKIGVGELNSDVISVFKRPLAVIVCVRQIHTSKTHQ